MTSREVFEKKTGNKAYGELYGNFDPDYTKMLEERDELMLEALKKSKRSHRYCEDSWYSCPKNDEGCANEAEGTDCNCGADEWNNYVDSIINQVSGERDNE